MATDIRTAYREAMSALMLVQPDEQAALIDELHQLYLDGRAAELFGASTAAGYPYPLPTDPVAAGADAIKTLAEAAPRGVILSRTLATTFTLSTTNMAIAGMSGNFTIPAGTTRRIHTVCYGLLQGGAVGDTLQVYTNLNGVLSSDLALGFSVAGGPGRQRATVGGLPVILGPGTYALATIGTRVNGSVAGVLIGGSRVDVIDDGPAV